jgi:hypothetical protein
MKLGKSRIAIVSLVLSVALLASALAAIMYQKNVNNTMMLSADYTIALYETGTITPCDSIAWGNFSESQTKTYVIDLWYLGNGAGFIYWNATVPSGWTLTLQTKNSDGASYQSWPSGLANKAGIPNPPRYMNIKLELTETTATFGTPYSFAVTFNSVDS